MFLQHLIANLQALSLAGSVEQVLRNPRSNAMGLTLSTGSITFGGNSKDGFVTIDVIAMSAGIPAELLTTRVRTFWNPLFAIKLYPIAIYLALNYSWPR